MKSLVLASAALFAIAATAFGDEITISFDSLAIQVYPSGLDPATCEINGAGPVCVGFTGTITDNDTDSSFLELNNISVTFNNPAAAAYFTLDNSFYNDTPGLYSGDPAAPGDGNPGYTFSGQIFGLGIAPGTPYGAYTGTIELDGFNFNDPATNLSFFSPEFTVEVVPEPLPVELTTVSLLALALLRFSGAGGLVRRRG